MIAVALYIVFCIGFAYINYKVIKANKRVYHGLNGMLHLAVWIAVFFTMKSLLLTLSLPFVARVFFDTSLNLWRGLPLDYVPKNPKSRADKIEKEIFGNNGLLPKIIWLLIITALLIIYHGQNIS